jgi:glutathione S-transferase
MLKVYGFSRVNKMAHGKTRDLRVLWALEEMGLPYEVVGMDHPQHDLDTPAYRALNPFGQIPAIDDEGVVVTESGAILLYLARKSGKLMPRDLAGEAQVLRWCVAALNTIEVPVLAAWFVDLNGGKGTRGSDALHQSCA